MEKVRCRELFKEFLIVFTRELAAEDVEEQRDALSDAHEFADELKSCFWNELILAFEYYEERYKTEKCIAYHLCSYCEISLKELQDHIKEYESIEEAVSEFLSDKYGYCANGFDFEIDGNVVKVSNIDWDLEE